MKAWILEKQSNMEEKPLRLMDVPKPVPKEQEVRVQIQACGICRTDIHIAEGDLPMKKSPLILGHEIVGKVDEIGPGVKHLKKRDPVGISWLFSTCGKNHLHHIIIEACLLLRLRTIQIIYGGEM